jgi:hypothetical protein
MAEIKISDLSIGDWVRVDDFDKVLIKRVSAIDGTRNQIGIIKNNRSGIYWYYDDEFEPIPLTPEILEKNGFEKLKDKSWVGHNHHCDIQQHGSSWTLLSNKRGFYRTICFESLEFVHELQHALRLADVRKEIEV